MREKRERDASNTGACKSPTSSALARRLAILLAGAAAAALMTAEPAPAIFINNNFDPNAPPVLAANDEFPNVLSVGSQGQAGGQNCTGTLISPTMVLTAAHCFFRASQPIGLFIGTQVDAVSPGNSPTIPASAVIINPGFDPKRTSASSDIAIVVLSSPINNLTPVNLQTTGSPLPPNTPVYIVGYGLSGRANGNDRASDGERRIAQSLIGKYLQLNQLPPAPGLFENSTQPVYAGQFRDPANPNQYNFFGLTATPPMLQGGTASGDSGGPLFICPKGNGDLSNCSRNELLEIGTLIGGGQPPAGQPPTGGGSVEFGYGDISLWTPLLVFADWVNGNGFSPIITSQPGNFNWSNTNAWANSVLPTSTNVAWLSNPGTIALDLNTQVSALWVTGQQSQLVIASPFTLTATTNTILTNGILTVNGTLNTPLLGITGGMLSGTGLITASGGTFVNNSAGTIAPGTSSAVGTLTIAGDYAQGPSGTLLIRVASTGSDRLAVTGAADLGGTLATLLTSSPLTRQYTVLHADGGLGGTAFDRVALFDVPPNFSAALGYGATDVSWNFTAALGLSSVLPSNASNVATAVNNFFNAGGTLTPNFGNLFFLTDGNLSNALSQLSGEAATGAQQPAFQLTNQFLGIMLDPFVDGRGQALGGSAIGFAPERQELRDDVALAYAKILKEPPKPPSFEQRWSVWGAGYGGSNRTTGDTIAVGSHDLAASTAGGAAGLDYRLAPGTVVGFALAGGGTNWSLAQGLGGGKSDAFQAGVYGTARSGPAYLATALAFTNHWMSTDRLAFAGDHLTASFNAQSYGGRVESGYRFATYYGGLTPYAAIQSQTFHTPGYTETDLNGGGFALGFNSRNATDTRSELGGRFDRLLLLNPEAALTLRARVAWAHDWISDPSLAPVFQTLPGASFIVNGATPAKNSALASAGAELRLANGVVLLAKFDGEFASHSSTYAGTGTLRYRW